MSLILIYSFQGKVTVQLNIMIKDELGDDIILTFGTIQQPFIFELNVSITSSQIWPVTLNLKLHSEAGGVSLGNSKYLLFGGIEDGSLSSVTTETYLNDHRNRSCKKLNSMNTPRYVFAFQRIIGRAYAVGGANCDEDENLVCLNECEYFDVNHNSWNRIAKLRISLMSSMSLSYSHQLYVFGGISLDKKRNSSILKYTEKLDNWSQLNFHLPYGLEAVSVYQHKRISFIYLEGEFKMEILRLFLP